MEPFRAPPIQNNTLYKLEELEMKKVLKAVAVVGAVVLPVVAGVRYANMKKALRKGQVNQWIDEVLDSTVDYEITPHIPVPAYIEDDKSKIYFRFNEQDLITLACSPQSFKDTVQALAAHELGHALDNFLGTLQKQIHLAQTLSDYDTYKRLVLEREQRAWNIGRDKAPNKAFFDTFNKRNMQVYRQVLATEKAAFNK